MIDLTMAHLRVVVEVAGHGSISAAAAALGYAQSAISRQLQSAEAAAGAVLFERSAAGVRPTQAGEVLLRRARAVLAEVDAAADELARLRGGLRGPLHIGAFPMAHAWLVPAALAVLAARHPGIEPRLLEASTPTLIARVRAGLLNGAVIAAGEGLPDYDLDGLTVAAMPPGHGVGVIVSATSPLASRHRLHVADLAGQTWVTGEGDRGDPQFGLWPGVLDATVAYTARTWQARIGIVMAGLAISTTPAIAAPILPYDIRWIPVADAGFDGRGMFVIMPNPPSAGIEAFARTTSEVLNAMPEQS